MELEISGVMTARLFHWASASDAGVRSRNVHTEYLEQWFQRIQPCMLNQTPIDARGDMI